MVYGQGAVLVRKVTDPRGNEQMTGDFCNGIQDPGVINAAAAELRGDHLPAQLYEVFPRALGKGLVVLEALRCAHPWASDRLHAFVIQGMAANAAAFLRTGALYVPYLEPANGAGKGLLETLAARACMVVTDRFPAFFLPRMVAAAGARLRVRLDEVDGNGLLPLSATARSFPTAHAFRRFLQQVLPGHLEDFPAPDPLSGALLPPVRLAPEITARSIMFSNSLTFPG